MGLQKAPWGINDGHQFGWLYGSIWKEINPQTFSPYKKFLEAVGLLRFPFFGCMSFFAEWPLVFCSSWASSPSRGGSAGPSGSSTSP